jgi:NADH-quinone oxidoreductase subunit I
MSQAATGLFSGTLSLLKGMECTLRTMLRPAITVQYPDQKLTMPERWRGVLSLEVSKCLSCSACVRACPAQLLALQFHQGADKKRKLDALRWEGAACAHCDLCVEACPTDALAFYHDYEVASFTREELFVDLAAKKSGEVGELPTGLAPEKVTTITPDGGSAPVEDSSTAAGGAR